MKIKLFLFLSCFFSCHFVLADKLADLSLVEQQSLCLTESTTLINKKNQEAYQALIEESLVYRALSMKTAQQLLIKVNNKNVLSGADLDRLKQGVTTHFNIRDRLFIEALKYECWINPTESFLAQYHISEEQRLQGIMHSLSAALVLYDNYLFSISLFEKNTKLKRLLNDADKGYQINKGSLTQISLHYYDLDLRERLKKAIQFYSQPIQQSRITQSNNPQLGYLDLLIQQSPTFHSRNKPLFKKILALPVTALKGMFNGMNQLVFNNSLGILSKIFGNLVGLVEVRKGKLFKQNKIKQHLIKQLKAGDILLEKTPFRLTDKLIPGYWGHVAIWVGSEQELKALGLWQHPIIKPYQKQIKAGRQIIEALRSDVTISSLDSFLNIDDLAILRPKISKAAYIRSLVLAFRQIGKAYDFNFNVETTDKIVCSELVYTAYIDIDWAVDKVLGRFTISPDNVAKKVGKDKPLQLVQLYLNGTLQNNNSKQQFQELIKH